MESFGGKVRDTEDEFKGAEFRDEETRLMFAYDYKNRFGEDFLDAFKKEFETAEREGLAKLKDDCIVPTARGFDLQNRLVGILIQNL